MEMEGREMCHARQDSQLELLIEPTINVFEYAVQPRRVFG